MLTNVKNHNKIKNVRIITPGTGMWRVHIKGKGSSTGDFMKKVPTATCALRDRKIDFIERVYTSSTFYMKSAVYEDQLMPRKWHVIEHA